MTAISFESTSRWSWIPWKVILSAFAAGLIGLLLGRGCLVVVQHVQQDHQALHELAVIELQRQQAQQQKK